jgi:hypothetical protein
MAESQRVSGTMRPVCLHNKTRDCTSLIWAYLCKLCPPDSLLGLHQVVVTGLGPVSAVGIGLNEFWTSLVDGKTGIDRISGFDPEPFACQVSPVARVAEGLWGVVRDDVSRECTRTLFHADRR